MGSSCVRTVAKHGAWSPTLTISNHFVQLWAENAVQGFLWEGSRCSPASLRLGRHWGTVCQGPNVQTSCGNTQSMQKQIITQTHVHTYTATNKILSKNEIRNIELKWEHVYCHNSLWNTTKTKDYMITAPWGSCIVLKECFRICESSDRSDTKSEGKCCSNPYISLPFKTFLFKRKPWSFFWNISFNLNYIRIYQSTTTNITHSSPTNVWHFKLFK